VLRKHAQVAPIRKMLDTPDKENGFYSARLNLDLNIEDPDYPALMLANYIFGEGGLKSRLMDRIRQKDGLSYGGGSAGGGRARSRRMFGISAIRRRTCASRCGGARGALRARSRAASRRPNWRAKSACSGGCRTAPRMRCCASGWAAYLYRGKTFEWSRQFEQKLAAVTLPQLNAAFRKAIDPSQLSVVMAGDQKKATPDQK
jgi:zinc protease